MSVQYNHNLAIPKTLLDYCDDRTRAVEAMRVAFDAIERADRAVKGFSFGLPRSVIDQSSMAEATRFIDGQLWRMAFDVTGLLDVMDASALAQFRLSCEREPPPFTVESVREQMLTMYQEAGTMFARGVYNVFRQLPSRYRTNEREPFKIDRKAILSYMFENRWSGGIELRYARRDLINDIDRVFKKLADEPYTARTLESAINTAMTEPPYVYDDAFFQVKGFKNGNAHFLFKRGDLLDKVNKIIGDYCNGNALAN